MKNFCLTTLVIVLLPVVASAQTAPQNTSAAQAGAQVSIGVPDDQAPPPAQVQPAQQPPPAPGAQPVYVQPVYGAPQSGYGPVYVQPGYAPQPGYAQPGYAPVYGQPRYAQPGYPPGYQPQLGNPGDRLIKAGAIVLGVMYGLTAIGGLIAAVSGPRGETEGWLSLIPIGGPFVNAAMQAPHAQGSVIALLYILDGLVQTGGAVMLIAGLARNAGSAPPPARTATNRHQLQWAVVPVAPGAQAGATLSIANF